MRHPKVETWAWICVITLSIPAPCSPAKAFTSCQALIRSSNSNPAPLIDRSVADARFTLAPRGAFGFDVFLGGAISFRMPVARDYCHICRIKVGAGSSRPYYVQYCRNRGVKHSGFLGLHLSPLFFRRS